MSLKNLEEEQMSLMNIIEDTPNFIMNYDKFGD